MRGQVGVSVPTSQPNFTGTVLPALSTDEPLALIGCRTVTDAHGGAALVTSS